MDKTRHNSSYIHQIFKITADIYDNFPKCCTSNLLYHYHLCFAIHDKCPSVFIYGVGCVITRVQ